MESTLKHTSLYFALVTLGLIGAVFIERNEKAASPKKKNVVIIQKKQSEDIPESKSSSSSTQSTLSHTTANDDYKAQYQEEYNSYVADYKAQVKAVEAAWYNQLKNATKWGLWGSNDNPSLNTNSNGVNPMTTDIKQAISYDMINYSGKFGIAQTPVWNPPVYDPPE